VLGLWSAQKCLGCERGGGRVGLGVGSLMPFLLWNVDSGLGVSSLMPFLL